MQPLATNESFKNVVMGWEIKNSNDIQYGRRVYPRSLELIHERRYAYVAYHVHGFRAVWSLWLPTEVEVHVLVQDGLVMVGSGLLVE